MTAYKKTTILIAMFLVFNSFPQDNEKARLRISNSSNYTPISGVKVSDIIMNKIYTSNVNGYIYLEYIHYLALEISKKGYKTIKVYLTEDDFIDIEGCIVFLEKINVPDKSLINISEIELIRQNDIPELKSISGLYNSRGDLFDRHTMFNMSNARFRRRGYNYSENTITINNIKINSLYDGNVNWSTWSGIMHALKKDESTSYIESGNLSFGKMGSVTNYNSSPSNFRKITKAMFTQSNKTYKYRRQIMYNSGVLKDKLAFNLILSRKSSERSYFEGTDYNLDSFLAAIDYKIQSNSQINFTFIYTPLVKGKSSPNTKEVWGLTNNKYNSYWGFQQGKVRNSRIKKVKLPMVFLNYKYNIKDNIVLKLNILKQYGFVYNSRIGYNRAANPLPTYYQYLPSYFVRYSDDENFSNAYLVEKQFRENQEYRQLKWDDLYYINSSNPKSKYYMYDDVVSSGILKGNASLEIVLDKENKLNISSYLTIENSENYAEMTDLLGGELYYDTNPYSSGDAMYQDLENKNKPIKKGDRFIYNYEIESMQTGFAIKYKIHKYLWDSNITLDLNSTIYRRNGIFRNGGFANNSLGQSELLSFFGKGLKWDNSFKLSNRSFIKMNSMYSQNPPTVKTSFINMRVNNSVNPYHELELRKSIDMAYYYTGDSDKFQTKIFYSQLNNTVDGNFYFAQGLKNDSDDFVSETMYGINKLYKGVEIGFEKHFLAQYEFFTILNYGEYTYANKPKLMLQSESTNIENGNYGNVYIENYRLSGGPQAVFAFGLKYNSPKYWWVGLNNNFAWKNYIQISPLLRTSNFFEDENGSILNDIDRTKIISLLKQEDLGSSFYMNMSGGKSFRIKGLSFYLFISMNNIFNKTQYSGGFEQSRNANYELLLADKNREKPLFPSKYWMSYGTLYFLNLSVRM
ncbi:MAG: hypothetical protein HRT66_03010 [Flavobacteriaceae bacterium]|nr:hypothetical protein [Flavobacteriaceae bacterium]